MKKILITGASGFIGSNLIPQLKSRDYEIHAIFNNMPSENSAQVVWHKCDIMNYDAVKNLMAEIKPEYLIHLAWFVTPGKWAIAPENINWVQCSINLLESFHNNGGQRVLFAGSGLEYDWRYGYCNEELTPKSPATFYGVCKNSLKELFESYCELVGLNYVWARLFFLYGPNENPNRLIAYVINSLLKGEQANCSHGKQVRDFLHAYDAANALLFLLESSFIGDINVASGNPVTLKELMTIAAEELDAVELLKLGAIPAAPSDTDLVVADVNKLKNELGWEQKFDHLEGIKDTINWWRTEHQR